MTSIVKPIIFLATLLACAYSENDRLTVRVLDEKNAPIPAQVIIREAPEDGPRKLFDQSDEKGTILVPVNAVSAQAKAGRGVLMLVRAQDDTKYKSKRTVMPAKDIINGVMTFVLQTR